MAHIKPFPGLRPRSEKISEVASPPYDVLDSNEAREKAKDNPYSFLHIIKPEIDCDPEIDLYDGRVYAKGGENLRHLINDGIMVIDKSPHYYIYKLRMGAHEQIGLVAVASLEDYIQNRIKKHEHTRPDKEDDRMKHIDSLNAQTGPVFLTYRAKSKIDSLITQILADCKPVYDFTGDYSIQHTFYVVDNEKWIQPITDAFKDVDTLYVADGHHRSAAAARVRDARKKINPNHTGEEPYNFFLSVIFPDNQLNILDYNRVVKDLNGLSDEDFFLRVQEKFDVQRHETCGCCGEDKTYHPEKMHCFGMYVNGQWYKLTAKENSFDNNDPIKQLDVSILQENLLSPIIGIHDQRTDKRINFIGGIRGLKELERLVDKGEYKVAFSLYPTSIDQLLAVADADKVMPPKSTWFEPKLRSGVIVHMLAE